MFLWVQFILAKKQRSEASLQFNLAKRERSEASLQFDFVKIDSLKNFALVAVVRYLRKNPVVVDDSAAAEGFSSIESDREPGNKRPLILLSGHSTDDLWTISLLLTKIWFMSACLQARQIALRLFEAGLDLKLQKLKN